MQPVYPLPTFVTKLGNIQNSLYVTVLEEK